MIDEIYKFFFSNSFSLNNNGIKNWISYISRTKWSETKRIKMYDKFQNNINKFHETMKNNFLAEKKNRYYNIFCRTMNYVCLYVWWVIEIMKAINKSVSWWRLLPLAIIPFHCFPFKLTKFIFLRKVSNSVLQKTCLLLSLSLLSSEIDT